MAQSVLDARLRRVTPSEAERANVVNGVTFGHIHDDWERLKAKLAEGDELWYFRTPDETWRAVPNCGLEGYAIVRQGTLFDLILTGIG